MRVASARSEPLDSALSEYLRPSDLEDAEARENENPNMYYETQSHKSGVEEMIEKNMQDESISKPSNKEKLFSEKFNNFCCEIAGNLRSSEVILIF